MSKEEQGGLCGCPDWVTDPVRSPAQVLDWRDVCQRCDEISLAAHYAVLGVGVEPLSVVAREVGPAGVEVRGAQGRRASCTLRSARGQSFQSTDQAGS